MSDMLIEVKLFAGLREAAGAGEVEVELDEGATAGGLLEQLKQAPGLGQVLSNMPVRVAVNRAYVDEEERLSEGDEVALVPPISGGAQVRATVSDRPLDVAAATAAAGDPAAGAQWSSSRGRRAELRGSTTRPTARWPSSGSARSSPNAPRPTD